MARKEESERVAKLNGQKADVAITLFQVTHLEIMKQFLKRHVNVAHWRVDIAIKSMDCNIIVLDDAMGTFLYYPRESVPFMCSPGDTLSDVDISRLNDPRTIMSYTCDIIDATTVLGTVMPFVSHLRLKTSWSGASFDFKALEGTMLRSFHCGDTQRDSSQKNLFRWMIKSCPNLESLSFKWNPYTPATQNLFRGLVETSSLTALDLQGCSVDVARDLLSGAFCVPNLKLKVKEVKRAAIKPLISSLKTNSKVQHLTLDLPQDEPRLEGAGCLAFVRLAADPDLQRCDSKLQTISFGKDEIPNSKLADTVRDMKWNHDTDILLWPNLLEIGPWKFNTLCNLEFIAKYDPGIMHFALQRNRRRIQEWRRIVVTLAFIRANQGHPFRDSIVDLASTIANMLPHDPILRNKEGVRISPLSLHAFIKCRFATAHSMPSSSLASTQLVLRRSNRKRQYAK